MSNYNLILKKNFAGISGVLLLNIISSLAMVFAGYSLSFLVSAYEYDGDKIKALIITFVIELVIWISAMGIYYITWLLQAKLQQKIKNDLRRIIGEKISALEYGEFTGKDCGNYVSWLTNDVEQIYSQSFSPLFSAVENFSAAAFSLAALFMLSWQIGAAAIVLLVLISVLPQLANKKLQKANEARSEALEIGTESYKDVIMGGSVFFLSNLRERIVERISDTSEKAEKVCFRYNVTNATVQSFVMSVSMIGQIVLLFVTLLAVVAGSTATGAVLSVGNLSGSFFNGAGDMVQAFMTIRASKPLWEKFRKDNTKSTAEKADIKEIQSIKVENLSFGYGNQMVLENKNYVFNAGGKYAILGESGSGKTTLVKIILGLLPQYSGRVLYGDIEQRGADLESLYNKVAYVDQQVYLFQDTLRFNITLGRDYSDDEIASVLRKCRLDKFVDSLPNGIDTVISENGKNLSGGQRQRIAIARSLIRKVEYIIMDEGTSALDETNALDIESALLDDENLGVIIITHNLRPAVQKKLSAVLSLT
ncbi:MAG: ABC transporter ATP-binding protein [Oscillospiraceae bacterium]|nr:ABC transporter ATP-binding protein [Oscillospiraceae bacterium]